MDNFGGHHKIGLYLAVNPMHIRVFSFGQCTELGVFLGGVNNFKYFLGVLEIPGFFFWFFFGGGVNGRCRARAYV